jgi:hypothetical protein
VYQGGNTSNTYTLIQDADDSLLLKGFNSMKIDLSKLGFSGQPILFGRGVLERAVLSAGYGCCNQLGQDFGVMKNNPGFKYYIDEYTATALGNANSFGAIMPGAVQMVPYNKYVGNFAGLKPGTTTVRGTIPSMKYPGVNFDYKFLSEPCDGDYTIVVGLWFGLYALPATMFRVGDRLVGVTGSVKGIAAANVVA